MNGKDQMEFFLGRERELYEYALRQVRAAAYNKKLPKQPWLRQEEHEHPLGRRPRAMRLAEVG